MARFSRILLVGSIPTNRATRLLKRPLGPLFALAHRVFFMALWPDSLESYWWRGLVRSFQANRATRPSKIPLGSLFALAPRPFFMVLWPDSLEPSWWEASQPIGPQGRRKGTRGHFSHWPQGPFLWPCGPIL